MVEGHLSTCKTDGGLISNNYKAFCQDDTKQSITDFLTATLLLALQSYLFLFLFCIFFKAFT